MNDMIKTKSSIKKEVSDDGFTRGREARDNNKAPLPHFPKRCRKFRKIKEGWECSECGSIRQDVYETRTCGNA